MDSIVIGTAGHIDHGKTALVKALTGLNTDTLEEEKRRGITVNLGFAYFTLPNGKIAGIVDVPGHERFIKNMLAGASGIDIAMVVVAANEGVMPQTKEHIDILSYMNIQKSIVVITKIDTVDDEFKELVLEDTRDYIQTTYLKDAPFFEVDSLSGKGIDELITYLDAISQNLNTRKRDGNARMSVDRVFTIKGFGTVVTGTLSDGIIRVDDNLMIYPEQIPTKVRTLQIHERDVKEAHAGQRTAINLAGVTTNQIQRGCIIAKPGTVFVTKVIDVFFSLTKSSHVNVKRAFACKMYIGAKELVVKINPLGLIQVTPDQEAYGQILLNEPAAVRRGDSFVLRTISPVETIGGGVVIDPTVSRYKKVDETIIETVKIKHIGTTKQILEVFIKAHPFHSSSQLLTIINVDSISNEIRELLEEKSIAKMAEVYVHKDLLDSVRQYLIKVLGQYHKDFPLRQGMPKAELSSRQMWKCNEKEFDMLLGYLKNEKVIQIENGAISLYGFTPSLSNRNQELMLQIEDQVDKAGYILLTAHDITGDSIEKKQLLELLLQERFMLLDGHYIISRNMYADAISAAKDLGEQNGSIRLSDFRDRLSTSRRFALLLLERFDRERITKRKGEDRELL